MHYLLLLVILFSSLFAQEKEKITLQLQWKHQFEFAGFYAAKEKGFYEKVGLDVEFVEFSSEMNIVDEVLEGDAEYGLSYSTLIADYMEGKPLVFVANFFKQSPLVLVTQKEIQTPADLKGKKIMGLLDSTHKQIFLTMFDKFNLEENDFTNLPRKFSIESFVKKEVDALSVFTTNEIYTLNNLGVQYNILDPANFGTKFYDINLFTTKSELENNPTRVENFRKASIQGWEYALEHKEEMADLIIQKYNTQNKTKEALLFEANQIEYLMLTKIYPIGSIDLERVELIADSFSQTLMIQKESKGRLEDFIYKAKNNTLELTKTQKEYLHQKKVLKMCVDPNWMPLEKIEEEKHIGIAADFIQLISKKLDTPIKLIPTEKWSQSLEKAYKKECDILALAEETPLRKKYLNFTTPYIKMPLVVATKSGVPFSNNLHNIQEKPLGVVKNYSIYELLKTKYPEINLVEVESIQEGLSYVEKEKIFGFLNNSLVINHEIQKNNLHDTISITGQFSETLFLSIASRNDEPILHEVLEKALLSIDNHTREQIINKWNNISYQSKIDYQIIIQLLFFGLVLITIFIYWNLKLKEEIKNKELAKTQLKITQQKLKELNNSLEQRVKDEIEKNTQQQMILMHQSKLAQMGEMIENIAHQWRQPLAQINSAVLVLDTHLEKNGVDDEKIEEKLIQIESLTAYMSKTIDDFKNFFHPNKNKELFKIKNAVENSYDVLKGRLQTLDIEIVFSIQKDLECNSYMYELQQVLLTLLNNAIDALEAKKIEEPKIELVAKEFHHDIIITIQDNALGIDEAIKDKIFEPYFTTKHKSQGTGLGLYMAKMIVESGFGGSLSGVNKKGGVCFTIQIPKGE